MKQFYKQYLMRQSAVKDFLQAEDGFGTVEMVIMLFVLIGLVIIFRNQTVEFINAYFAKMDPNLSLPAVK